MLAGLAFKRRWQQRRRDAGEPVDTPNIVFSSSVQVVWEKFANYWEVEPRYVPITKERPYLTPEGMLEAVDEHTIGVVGILGVTYDGRYEPISDSRPRWTISGTDRARRAAPRRRRVRGVHRSVPRSRSPLGLPPPPRALDQHVGSQVRALYPGLGWVVWAKPVPPRGPDLL